MHEEITKSRIGARAFDAIVAASWFPEGVTELQQRRIVASVLAASAEYAGARLPAQQLQLNEALTVKAFPDGAGALTTLGLTQWYERKGWHYMVLRVGPLVRGVLGQTERLQELLALYEAQCATEGVSSVPEWADGPGIAGGTGDAVVGA